MKIADRRPLPEVGRHARLELVFGCRGGRTVLEQSYAEPPLRVGRCFPDDEGLHLIMASSAPGIFGGDSLDEHVRVERGARVRLTSQSALQVHPGLDDSPARIRSVYEVEDGGHLHCQWDPLIPFSHSRLEQRVDVRLGEAARLYWSDAWMAGREGRDERWLFDLLSLELRVSRVNVLEYLERYSIRPAVRSQMLRPWTAGDSCYFGTILQSGGAIDRPGLERLHAGVADHEDLRGAVDALGDQVALARLMARAGPPFHRARVLLERAMQGAGGLTQQAVVAP